MLTTSADSGLRISMVWGNGRSDIVAGRGAKRMCCNLAASFGGNGRHRVHASILAIPGQDKPDGRRHFPPQDPG
jgi:hypothetical protein